MKAALKKQADELARTLSVKHRIEFVDRLLSGINDFATPEIERAWNREIKRRLDDYKSGRAKIIPSAQVHARIRRKLNEIRTRRASSRRVA
jgi:putative addiction module component (TIGR02574 family)